MSETDADLDLWMLDLGSLGLAPPGYFSSGGHLDDAVDDDLESTDAIEAVDDWDDIGGIDSLLDLLALD